MPYNCLVRSEEVERMRNDSRIAVIGTNPAEVEASGETFTEVTWKVSLESMRY